MIDLLFYMVVFELFQGLIVKSYLLSLCVLLLEGTGFAEEGDGAAQAHSKVTAKEGKNDVSNGEIHKAYFDGPDNGLRIMQVQGVDEIKVGDAEQKERKHPGEEGQRRPRPCELTESLEKQADDERAEDKTYQVAKGWLEHIPRPAALREDGQADKPDKYIDGLGDGAFLTAEEGAGKRGEKELQRERNGIKGNLDECTHGRERGKKSHERQIPCFHPCETSKS